MQYLTVGTREITKKLFREVEDTEPANMKPRGGLWLTKYDDRYKNYNEWVEFIVEEPVTFFYKSRNYSMWEQPCSLVTLKDSANLFNLKTKEDLTYLKNNYPLDNDKFSYQAISHIYDGIFVNMNNLLFEINDNKIRERLFKFGVNSLILFNLDCIDYYQSGLVLIEPFDYEFRQYEAPTYEIKIEDAKKRILKKAT